MPIVIITFRYSDVVNSSTMKRKSIMLTKRLRKKCLYSEFFWSTDTFHAMKIVTEIS